MPWPTLHCSFMGNIFQKHHDLTSNNPTWHGKKDNECHLPGSSHRLKKIATQVHHIVPLTTRDINLSADRIVHTPDVLTQCHPEYHMWCRDCDSSECAQAHENHCDGDRYYHYHALQISYAKHVSKTWHMVFAICIPYFWIQIIFILRWEKACNPASQEKQLLAWPT